MESVIFEAIIMPYCDPMEPEYACKLIKELNRYYSKNDGFNVHREHVKKLAELPNLTGCDDETFLKLDLLSSPSRSRVLKNVDFYLIDQRIKIAKRCDDELQYDFTRKFYKTDREMRESLEQLANYAGLETSLDHMNYRPLFTKSELLEGIYEVLALKSRKISRREVLAREELKSFFDPYILGACGITTLEFDRMSRFYIRNYLEKGTLKYCNDSSKKWVFIAEMCSTIMANEVEILDSILKVVERYHDAPESYLYEIVNEILKE